MIVTSFRRELLRQYRFSRRAQRDHARGPDRELVGYYRGKAHALLWVWVMLFRTR